MFILYAMSTYEFYKLLIDEMYIKSSNFRNRKGIANNLCQHVAMFCELHFTGYQ